MRDIVENLYETAKDFAGKLPYGSDVYKATQAFSDKVKHDVVERDAFRGMVILYKRDLYFKQRKAFG